MESSDIELAYVAGILDAKATIGFYLNGSTDQYRLELVITTKHQALVEQVRRVLGVGKIRKEGKTWRWKCYTAQAERVLKTVLPFLVIQKRRALLLVEFGDTGAPDTLSKVLAESKKK